MNQETAKTAIMGQELEAMPQMDRDAASGQFLPGHKPTSTGRGLSGRSKAIRTLDAMLASEGNQARLKEALQEYFDKNPIRFFKTIIMPLLPKEARLEMETGGAVLWTRISEMYPPKRETPEDVIDI